MDISKKTTYLFSIDALRVIAILSVIAIHISIKNLAVLNHNLITGYIPFFINQVTRFAVPLFFLISGFVLELNYKEKLSYFIFFKKRASRVILPFLFWSIIYVFYTEGFGFLKHLDLNFLIYLIEGKAAYHLYFIPTLILFYLAFPIFHKLLNFLKNPIVISLIIISQFYFLYTDYYIKNLDINDDLRIAILSYSMFIFGMVASHYKENILSFAKKFFIPIVILFIALFLYIPFHVYTISLKYDTSGFIYNQYNPLNYFYTIVFALLFFYILEKTQFARKIFIEISKLSFFVFFIHVLIQYLVWDNIVAPLIKTNGEKILTNFYFTPLLIIFLSLISFSIAYIAHKIPHLSKITG